MGLERLVELPDVLEKVEYNYYTNTSFLLEDKYGEQTIDYINDVMNDFFEVVFKAIKEHKYTHPPFYEEVIGHLLIVYIKIDGKDYIMISDYGNAIRKMSEEDKGKKKAIYYLDINTMKKTYEVKKEVK